MRESSHKRESNIELLRILSMFMILGVHFDGASFDLENPMTLAKITNINVVVKQLIESVTIIGVNCFVLISGYFGIKPSTKGIVNFLLCCLFYSVIIYGINMIVNPECISLDNCINAFAILTKTDLWFIPAYFGLFLLSPVINIGLDGLSNKQLTIFITGLVFLNVYMGWFMSGSINPTGYNIMQMVFIYSIGKYISRYKYILAQA